MIPSPTSSPRPSDASRAILEVSGLRVTIPFHGKMVHAVRGVDFAVHPQQTVVLVGESGSGKSVTARAIIGLSVPGSRVEGSMRFGDTELVGLSEKELARIRGAGISMVFQDPSRSLNPTTRVGSQITEAIRLHLGLDRKSARARAVELLDLVGIGSPRERFKDYPHQLSGGMRQRVMIAIAIACNPQILIADEPTTALDVTTEAQIMELLISLQDQLRMAILLITHNMGLAFTYGDEIAVMYGGGIVERAPVEVLKQRVAMPYTAGLLASVPSLDVPPHSKLHSMGGRPPDATAPVTGCPFEPRCERATVVCQESLPSVTTEGDHSFSCWNPL